MKTILVVAALVAASVMPAQAASMAMTKTMTKAEAVPAYCYLLPLLPKCVEAWKAEMDAMKADMKK